MRYYFDLRDGNDLAIDEEGSYFLSLEAAQEEAALSLAHMARDAVKELCRYPTHKMEVEVRDDAGPLFHLKFAFNKKGCVINLRYQCFSVRHGRTPGPLRQPALSS